MELPYRLDGKRLYYCALTTRRLFSVSTDALVDPNVTDTQVEQTVHEEPSRKGASDGLESDAEGNLYLTDYEHNAVVWRSSENKDSVLVSDRRLLWPDTLAVASDGYLYVTANQLQRQPGYNRGKDLRQKPYYLFRVRIGAKPVQLLPASPARPVTRKSTE